VEGVATGIAFNAVGTQAWIAVNTADSSSVWQWDLKSATPQRMWPNVTLRGTIWLLQPAHDSRYALAIGGNNARLLEIETGRLITPFRPHNAVHSARFSPTGDEIISSGADGDVKIWNSNEHSNEFGRVRIKITRAHEIQNRALAVNDALFLHNGTTVVTAGDDHLVKIWRLRQDSAEIISTLSEHKQRVVSLALSNDGKQLMSASQDGTAKIWKLENIKPAITPHVSLHHPAPVACATFSPDGKLAVTGCADHVARVWSLEKTESPLLELSAHTASVTSVSISPDSLRLVTGSQDGIAKLWDIRTGEELLSLKHHTAEITSVHFSPDGTNILTSSGDRTGILFRTTLPHSTDSHKQPSP
jgi:WD40 repeat protein